MDGNLPLSGVRVADFGQLIAIPAATQRLAELGADVIKVEPPAGEIGRTMAAYGEAIVRGYNRGKRSLAIDVKQPHGLEVAQRLIASCDILCHNFRPGTMTRLGLGADKVRDINPRLINVSVTGYGVKGPSAGRGGLDTAAQAESGLMHVTGESDRDPQRVGTPIVDYVTSLTVVQAVLAAIVRRDKTGCGEDLRVPLLDVAIHMQTSNWTEQAISGEMFARKGNGQPNVAPGADLIRTTDGQFVLSAYTESSFARLCEAIGLPDLPNDERFTTNQGRVQNRGELLRTLSAVFADRGTEECVRQLVDAGIVAAVVRDYEQVRTAEDVVDNDIFVAATAADGSQYEVPRPPYQSSHAHWTTATGVVPKVGEHTNEILAELGFPADQIERIAGDIEVAAK